MPGLLISVTELRMNAGNYGLLFSIEYGIAGAISACTVMHGNLCRLVDSPETEIDIGLLTDLNGNRLLLIPGVNDLENGNCPSPVLKNHPALGWFSFCCSAVLATGPQARPVAFGDTAVHRVKLVADAFDRVLVQIPGLHV